jgi:hypothetical protein
MITTDQKTKVLEIIREQGTMKAAAKEIGVSVRALNEEMMKSGLFKRRVLDAREEGKRNIAERAINVIQDYAFNTPDKTDRNKLTAAIALANAYEPGFRGATKVEGHIDHNVRVLTAVPRPNYKVSSKPTKPQNARADLPEMPTLIGQWSHVKE